VSLPDIGDAWSHAQIASHYDVMPAYLDTDPDIFARLCFGGGGDPMTLTAMLLLLNQPSKFVALTHVARERGIYRGKLKSFKEHHVVKINLSPGQKVRDLLHTTERAAPIRHDVGGHWKHYNKAVGCNHHHPDQRQAWEPVGPERTESGDYKRYWCPLCLQRRTWTEHFMRGSEGLATKHYEVTR
jgi:hypothetical protein